MFFHSIPNQHYLLKLVPKSIWALLLSWAVNLTTKKIPTKIDSYLMMQNQTFVNISQALTFYHDHEKLYHNTNNWNGTSLLLISLPIQAIEWIIELMNFQNQLGSFHFTESALNCWFSTYRPKSGFDCIASQKNAIVIFHVASYFRTHRFGLSVCVCPITKCATQRYANAKNAKHPICNFTD